MLKDQVVGQQAVALERAKLERAEAEAAALKRAYEEQMGLSKQLQASYQGGALHGGFAAASQPLAGMACLDKALPEALPTLALRAASAVIVALEGKVQSYKQTQAALLAASHQLKRQLNEGKHRPAPA